MPDPNAPVEQATDQTAQPAPEQAVGQNPADTSTMTAEGDKTPEPTEGVESEQKPAEGESEDSEAPEYTYAGQAVEIEISDDLSGMLSEKGLDAQTLAAELYSGDEFGLSEETKGKLYEQFGKFAVDSYLNGLKAQNDLTLSRFETEGKAAQEAAQAAWTETLGIVGSEEGWNEAVDWAEENFTDQERAEWDEIMESDNWTMQRLAIQDLANRAGLKPSAAPQGGHPAQASGSMAGQSNGSLELIEANGGDSRADAGGAITAQEYRQMWSSSLSAQEMQALDARRRAGIQKGI